MVANKHTLPSIKLTDAQKKENDYYAIKLLADHYISKAQYKRTKSEFPRLRRLASNEVIDEDYKQMLTTYNYHKLNQQNADKTIKSMPLIQSITRLLKGEKRIAPLNFHTKVNNEDVQNRYIDSLNEMLVGAVDNAAVNALNRAGLTTNIQTEETTSISDQVEQHRTEYKDARAIAGHEILTGINNEKDLKEDFFRCYSDWIETGETYSIKSISHDDVNFKSVKPEECYVEFSSNSPYAEDGMAAAISQEWNITDVIRYFGSTLKEVSIKGADGKRTNVLTWLSSLVGLDGFGDPRPKYMMKDETFDTAKEFYKAVNSGSYGSFERRTIPVHYVTINLLSPVKILRYVDELGVTQEREVLDSYKVNIDNGDISAKRTWINEVWEVWRVGAGAADSDQAIYPIIRKLNPQRADINNSSTGRLPINGRNDGLAIPKVLEEYQYKYNLIHWIEEKTLRKDGGQPVILPLSMIPDDASWGKNSLERAETLFFYKDKFNAIIVDDAKMNPALAQIIKSVNMSTINAVEQFIKLKEQVKFDAWDAIGVNRQRQGETYASDGKATTEQALIRSSIMTADFNIAFNKFESSDLLGILDFSKVAYINGKTFTKYPNRSDYYISDTTRSVYEVDPEEHCESSYGISVAVAHLEQEKINLARAQAQPFLQNGVAAPFAYKAMTTDNPSKAEDYLKRAYEITQRYEEEQAELNRQSQERIASDNLAAKQAENDNKLKIEQIKAEIKKYEIDVDAYQKAAEAGLNSEAYFKNSVDNRKLNIEQQRVNNERVKINNDFKLGKEANKIAAKNKTANNNK